MRGLKFDEELQGWRHANHNLNEEADINAFFVGRIPYKWIKKINWNGDEYYGYPHLYCKFGNKGEPYEELLYFHRQEITPKEHYFSELIGWDEVKKNSKKFAKKNKMEDSYSYF